jgi:heterodisulfide reductase subunit B
MQVGYYPGCSLESSSKEFDISIRAILDKMGISLKEIPDWNCCGASPAHYLNEELGLSLPYMNLIKAEEEKLEKVLSPCPACYSHLIHVHKEVEKDFALNQRLKEIVGKEYQMGIVSRHLLDFIKEEIGLQNLKESLKKSLNGLKIVSYYGCLTRLPGVNIDDVENPTIMDEIIESIGGIHLDWSHKTECCGASLSITRTDIALRLCKGIIEAAIDRGANCISVVCPLCQSNLDTRQNDINKKYKTSFSIPVIYISQLIGLCQGLGYKELGLDRLIVSPKEILIQKGIIEE